MEKKREYLLRVFKAFLFYYGLALYINYSRKYTFRFCHPLCFGIRNDTSRQQQQLAS